MESGSTREPTQYASQQASSRRPTQTHPRLPERSGVSLSSLPGLDYTSRATNWLVLQTGIDVADAIVLATAETDVPFPTISEALSAWIEQMRDVLVRDLIDQGGEVDLWVHKGESERRVAYPREWERSLAAVAVSEATGISLGVAAPFDAFRGSKTFRLWVTPDPGVPKVTRIKFFASPRALLDEVLPPPAVWGQALQDGAVAINAVHGYLTVARAAIVGTAYEHRHLRSPVVGVREANAHVRGLFWGTVLSSRHIVALGGLRRVLEEAPVERVVDLSRSAEKRVYLELTDDLFAVTDTDEERLCAYLTPILPVADSR